MSIKVFRVFFLFFPVCLGLPVFAQDLSISQEDLRIEQGIDGGFHLYIRKKPGAGSVLLTESTRDPALRSDNYTYRAAEWNAVNGDEIRILDGVPLPRENRIYSIVDSTPEPHGELGEAFHLYIPYILYFGYENTRHGEIYVTDGTYFNIRVFSLPYADYRGSFRDNPYELRVTQRPGEVGGNYMKDAEDAFREIARAGSGDFVHSAGPGDLVEKIKGVLEREKGKDVDLVICLDTTNSMKNDIDAVREMLIPMLKDITGEFASFRIGMVLYKDYYEEYLNRVVPFTRNFDEFQRALNAVRVSGGRDIPEAVYEALYEGAVKFPWESETRLMILIGDAPPHPRPRGRITKEAADREINSRNIQVNAILLPQ